MQFDPNNPITVGYRASAGEVAVTRTRAQIKDALLAFKGEAVITDGLDDGIMVAGVMERSSDCSPSVIDYWDAQGRLVRTHFVGQRGGFANGATYHYAFDDEGRLIRFWQVAHREDGDFTCHDDRYEYVDGRPDEEYISHTSNDGRPFVTRNRQERMLESWM
jgi:hypothetical protein